MTVMKFSRTNLQKTADDGMKKHSNKLKLSENSDNDSAPDKQSQLSEKKSHKNKHSLSKKSSSKNTRPIQILKTKKKHTQKNKYQLSETSESTEDTSSTESSSDVPQKKNTRKHKRKINKNLLNPDIGV